MDKEVRAHDTAEKAKTKQTEREAAARVKAEQKASNDITKFVDAAE